MDTETKKLIEEVVDSFVIYNKNGRSKVRPQVVIPWATDFNYVLTIDLKGFGKVNIIWLVFAFPMTKQLKVSLKVFIVDST